MAVVDNRRWNQWYPQMQKSVEAFKEQHYKVTTRKSLPGNSNTPAVAMRFGSKSWDKHLLELMKLKQLGTVEQYQKRFEALLTGVDLPVGEVVNCFLNGLRREIQIRVRMFKPQTLYEAICLAKLQEATLAFEKKTTPLLKRPPSPLRIVQEPPLQQSTILEPRSDNLKQEQGSPMEVKTGIATQLESAAGAKPTRSCLSLSPVEIFAKWDKGLCELCDEPYVPGHKCKKIGPNTLFVVVAEEEEPSQPESGVDNHPVVDAPQVFDKSPQPTTCIKSEGRNDMLLNDQPVDVGPFLRKKGRENVIDKTRSRFTNVCVKNLAETTTDEDLENICDQYVETKNAVVWPDIDRNSKCLGFVDLGNANDAVKFVERLNGQKSDEKEWCAGKAQKKGEREAKLKQKFEQTMREAVVRLVFDPGEKIVTTMLSLVDLFFRRSPFGGEYTSFVSLAECKRFAAHFMFTVEKSKMLLEFKLKRAQGPVEGVSASRYCCLSDSNLAAGRMSGIPFASTHSHALVSSFMNPEEIVETSFCSAKGSTVWAGLVDWVQSWVTRIQRIKLPTGGFGKQSVTSDSDDGGDESIASILYVFHGNYPGKCDQEFSRVDNVDDMRNLSFHGYGGGIIGFLEGSIIGFLEGSSASDRRHRPLVNRALTKTDLTVVLPKVARRFDDVRQSGQFMTPDSCCQPLVSPHLFSTQRTPIHCCKYYDVVLEKVISFLDLALHKVANGFCVFAFDPGILGAGQRTPQPRTLLVLRLVFDPGSCFVILGSPTKAWEADSLMVFNEEELRAKIALPGSNDFVVSVVGSEFMYKDLWFEHALVLQALRPLLEKSPSENTSSSSLRIFILIGDSPSNYTKAVAYGAAVQAAVWSGRGNEDVQVDIDAFRNSREQSYTMLLLQLMSSRAVADEVLCWLCGTAKESEGYILQCASPFKSMELKQNCEQMMKETVKSLHMGGYRTFTMFFSQDDQSLLKWQLAVAVPSIDLNEFYAFNGPEVTMPRDGLQPWGVFDPGGMIILLTRLLLYTIHNLKAEGAVFDPGKIIVSRVTLAASSWAGAGRRVVMEMWVCEGPVTVQAQERCQLEVILSHHGCVFSLSPQSLRTSFSKGGRLIRANGGVTWLARRKEKARRREAVRVSYEGADSAGSGGTSFSVGVVSQLP